MMDVSLVLPLGQIVSSRQGRDKGQLYMVVGYGKSPFVLVADGRVRKAAKPKKKNARHVRNVGSIAQKAAQKLQSGTITDEEVRQAISELCISENIATTRTGREI